MMDFRNFRSLEAFSICVNVSVSVIESCVISVDIVGLMMVIIDKFK